MTEPRRPTTHMTGYSFRASAAGSQDDAQAHIDQLLAELDGPPAGPQGSQDPDSNPDREADDPECE